MRVGGLAQLQMGIAVAASFVLVAPAAATDLGKPIIEQPQIIQEYARQIHRQLCHRDGLHVTSEMVEFGTRQLQKWRVEVPDREERELRWQQASILARKKFNELSENPVHWDVSCSLDATFTEAIMEMVKEGGQMAGALGEDL